MRVYQISVGQKQKLKIMINSSRYIQLTYIDAIITLNLLGHPLFFSEDDLCCKRSPSMYTIFPGLPIVFFTLITSNFIYHPLMHQDESSQGSSFRVSCLLGGSRAAGPNLPL